MALNYSVYLETLPARSIYNLVGPRDHTDTSASGAARESRLLAKSPQFYADLEADILANGFTNPIIIVRNKWFTMEWGAEDQKRPACPQFGGSRLWVGQRHDLPIPVVVCDYDGKNHMINIDGLFPRYECFAHYIEAEL